MPIPAANIMAIHDEVRNSGRSSSSPSGMRPYLLKANHRAKTTNAVPASVNTHPPSRTSTSNAVLAKDCSDSVPSTPQAMNATAAIAEMPNTTQSIRPGWSTSLVLVGSGFLSDLSNNSVDTGFSAERTALPPFGSRSRPDGSGSRVGRLRCRSRAPCAVPPSPPGTAHELLRWTRCAPTRHDSSLLLAPSCLPALLSGFGDQLELAVVRLAAGDHGLFQDLRALGLAQHQRIPAQVLHQRQAHQHHDDGEGERTDERQVLDAAQRVLAADGQHDRGHGTGGGTPEDDHPLAGLDRPALGQGAHDHRSGVRTGDEEDRHQDHHDHRG